MSNDSMPHDPDTSSDWDDCSQGELSQMVRKIEASQDRARNKKLFKVGTLSMLLVACGIVIGGSFIGQDKQQYGGISCRECLGHFAEYHGHMTGTEQLGNSGLATSMGAHLSHCQYCRNRFNESYPGVLKSVLSSPARPHVSNPLPLLAVARQPTLY